MNASTAELRRLISEASGIVLDAKKDYLLESRLGPLIKELGCLGLDDLAVAIRARGVTAFQERLVNLMTTNETSFMRDQHPFETLRTHVLPELIASRESVNRLRIWSAASSTGQEIYSIAMILREHFPQLSSWDVKLLATDIDTDILDRAATGIYKRHEIIRGLPPEFTDKYMTNNAGGDYVVSSAIRNMVDFRRVNLCEDFTAGTQDLILCRNVLIYFDAAMKERIIRRLTGFLNRNGVLMLGATEMMPPGIDVLSGEKINRTMVYRPVLSARNA